MTDELPGSAVEVPPHVGGPHSAYIALLEERVLGFQACRQCSSAIFPPRFRCSACGADALEWRISDCRGVVYSSTVLTPRGESPYAVVLVDLDEGYRIMSRVNGGEIAIGDRVAIDVVSTDHEPLPMATRIEATAHA